MPLCMRMCHEHIRAQHHVKHGGRMQYGPFLKGIGVTLEDSIRFWREEFTKKMDADKFMRSYEYNIHHNYGKKGSMVNYTPYSCSKIIKEMAAPGDCHGCPYKSVDPATLKTKLASYGLSPSHIEEESQILMGNRQKRTAGSMPQKAKPRPDIKGHADRSMLNGDDDDELWKIAETQGRAYQSQKDISEAFNDDLDLTEITF
ncbi:DNA primase large subunit [Drosophila obscura]|uniref:DNA primase large subunit n=1 Tax=Drosophila obscura TaxID=7282 RepID=UPI001BB261C1|nr:DNA primase large subunit [Drosophila obscura]